MSQEDTGNTQELENIEAEQEGQELCEDERHDTTVDDVKNFCATQACAEPSDVVKLADSTLKTLSALWTEIGYAPHECDNAKAEMFADVKRVFEKKMSSTQEVKCSINSQIRLTKARISTVEVEVGYQSSNAEQEDKTTGATLRDSLAACKGHLDALEQTKMERKEILDARAQELTSLFYQLDDALNTEQNKFLRRVSDFTQNRVEQFDERIRDVKSEIQRRDEVMQNQISSIQALWNELDISDESKAQVEVDQWIVVSLDIKLTVANIGLVTDRRSELEQVKRSRQQERETSFASLDKLWDRLKTPSEERDEFAGLFSDLSQATLDSLESEISRLEVVKKQKMKELVCEQRDTLNQLWESMRLSADQRSLFSPAYQEVFTDDSLLLHEEEVSRCAAKLEVMTPLIKIVERRDQIREEDAAMKAAQADPSRLLGRGRGMAEKLKQEEKVRNMVSKELPRLTEKLRIAISEYEAEHGDFMLDGRNITECLDEEAAAAALAKQDTVRSRGKNAPLAAAAQDLRPKTPAASAADRPTTAPSSSTPGHRLKAAAQSVVKAQRAMTPSTSTQGNSGKTCIPSATKGPSNTENENPQTTAPPSMLEQPGSRLMTPRTKLTFEAESTHVISPRTGKPKRMIMPKV